MRRGRHIVKIGAKIVLALFGLLLFVVFLANGAEYFSNREDIFQASDVIASEQQYDAIMVLGASVTPQGEPSVMLSDRLDAAIELYEAEVAPCIIMSGDDFSDEYYDEVTIMKEYVVAKGVPSEAVFCDHAGVCTYDSMYRAQYVFGVNRMVVVTQTYHLYRALYDAEAFGIRSIGVSGDIHGYDSLSYYRFREFFARVNDYIKVWTRAEPAYLSEPVSLDQSGDVTTW